jgi:hypothetical protein
MLVGNGESLFPAPYRANAGASIRAAIRFLYPPLSSRTARFPQSGWKRRLSARSLPSRQAVHAMVRKHGRLFGLLLASSGWLVRDTPDTVFRSALPLQTVPAQGSLAPEALPSFIATTSPSASPDASRLYFVLRTYNERPCRLHHPRLVTGTFPTVVYLSVLECCALYTGGSSSANDQFFLDDIGLRPTTLGSALRVFSHKTASRGLSISIRQAFLNVTALQLASPPCRSAPHCGT